MSAGGASEAVKSQSRAGPSGAAVDDAALRAWAGALRVRDFSITDERGVPRVRLPPSALRILGPHVSVCLLRQPLDSLNTADAPALYISGSCDKLVSGVLQMARPAARRGARRAAVQVGSPNASARCARRCASPTGAPCPPRAAAQSSRCS